MLSSVALLFSHSVCSRLCLALSVFRRACMLNLWLSGFGDNAHSEFFRRTVSLLCLFSIFLVFTHTCTLVSSCPSLPPSLPDVWYKEISSLPFTRHLITDAGEFWWAHSLWCTIRACSLFSWTVALWFSSPVSSRITTCFFLTGNACILICRYGNFFFRPGALWYIAAYTMMDV